MKHIFYVSNDHPNCQIPFCSICEGGLAICKVCGQAEAELAVDCPGPSPKKIGREKTQGWQIIAAWCNRVSPNSQNWPVIQESAWNDLIDSIDTAIREAEQWGRDYRKRVQVMKDQSEHGPFWQQFYLRVLFMPGVTELFDIEGILPQWNEAIRIRFKKPTLRAVDPNIVIDWIGEQFGMVRGVDDEMITGIRNECRQIIRDLTQQASGELSVFISPMEMKA